MSTIIKQPHRAISTLLLLLLITTTIHLFRQPASSDKNAPRIAILSMTSKETDYDWISISNKHEYASKHSYDLIWSFTPPTVISNYAKQWDKLDMIRDAVHSTLSGKKKYEWIWMLDYDTLITNPAIRVEEIINQSLHFALETEGKPRESIDLILTRDCEPLNVGSVFIKPTPWILSLLDEWRSGQHPETPNRTEQDVLRDMLLDDVLGLGERSVVVPQTMFNAYPEELGGCRDERDGGGWVEGMFVVHFAGAEFALGERGAVGSLMRRYYGRAFGGREVG